MSSRRQLLAGTQALMVSLGPNTHGTAQRGVLVFYGKFTMGRVHGMGGRTERWTKRRLAVVMET